MSKKNIMKQALIEASELETAAIENAKNILMESITPSITEVFRDILSEGEDKYEVDDETNVDFKDEEDEEIEEGTEHDMGKEPDAGRDDTDAATAGEDLKEEWEAVHHGGEGKDPHKNEPSGLDGTSPADQTTEGGSGEKTEDPGKGEEIEGTKVANDTSGGTPVPPSPDPGKGEASGLEKTSPADQTTKDLQEADDKEEDKEEDSETEADKEDAPKEEAPKKEEPSGSDEKEKSSSEELEVPDELFDEEKGKDEDSETGEDDIKMVSKNDDDDEGDEELDVEFEDDAESDDGGAEAPDDISVDTGEDEFDEGLYMRSAGEFQKVTPAEYLQTRISKLEEEKAQLTSAVHALSAQVNESNVFNAKLAYVNQLYNSGLFTKMEKEGIAERMDECDSIDEAKSLYKKIIVEVKNKNPLDDFSDTIRETRIAKNKNVETIAESSDLTRMRELAGILTD